MVKKICIIGTDELQKLKKERGEKYIEPWYANRLKEEFDVDTVIGNVYVVIDTVDGRYKSVIIRDADVIEE